MTDLAAAAGLLRELHRPTLVLANVWDAATARLAEDAGCSAIATSSHAIADAFGVADTDVLGPDRAFAAVGAIASAVSVPVTADLEAGYALPPDELVERLLAAGAVGCNLEDTDHHGDQVLVDAEAQAARIAAVKDAGRTAGVDLVVNARTDAYARGLGTPGEQLEESLRRGRLYRRAGADCVYPILVADPAAITTLVAELKTVNVMSFSGGPSIEELRALGAARVTVGSGLARVAMKAFSRAAERLLAGEASWWSCGS
jgi:2-methylisocitrate lyase-like PEP mutase family enzyme